MAPLVMACFFGLWQVGVVAVRDEEMNHDGEEMDFSDSLENETVAQGNEHFSVGGDPQFCNAGVNCKKMKKRCPCTCKQPECSPDTKKAVQVQVSGESLPMSAISDKLTGPERLQIRNSKTYKRIWPKTCAGKRKGGGTVATDNFPCDEDTGHIHGILSPDWHKMGFISKCCKGSCLPKGHRDTVRKGMCPGHMLTLSEAAAAASTGINSLETASGAHVPLDVRPPSKEVRARTGLIAEVEVQALGENLQFHDWKPELTEHGAQFLSELGEPLSMLLKLQLTAYAKESGVQILFCPHGATGRDRKDLVARGMEQLPKERADVLANRLEGMGVNSIGQIGTAVAHYRCEGSTNFAGGVFGSILYKIHEGGSRHTCDPEDFYKFTRARDEKACAELRAS